MNDPSTKTTAPVYIMVPIHPPKLNWLISLIDSLKLNVQSDIVESVELVLLVSNFEDWEIIGRVVDLLSCPFRVTYVCIDTIISDRINSEELSKFFASGASGGLAVFKKLIGLWTARDLGGLIVCIDADTYCTRLNELDIQQMNINYTSGIYLGSPVSIHPHLTSSFTSINKKCLDLLKLDNLEVEKVSFAIDVYTWYYDLPLYKGSDLDRMFRFLEKRHGSLEAFLLSLDWNAFEHILYAFWRAVEGDATITDYTNSRIRTNPEGLKIEEVARIKERWRYAAQWAPASGYFRERNRSLTIDFCFLSHFDRFSS